MSHEMFQSIRIGTLVQADNAVDTVRAILPHGFESFQITFGQRIGDIDLLSLADELKELLSDTLLPYRPKKNFWSVTPTEQ